MKKYVLTLMMVIATITLKAEEEVTVAPSFIMGWSSNLFESNGEPNYTSFIDEQCQLIEEIENLDEVDATIYYRLANTSGTSEWIEYTGGEINPVPLGVHSVQVEAYAKADGKLPSDIVSTYIVYMDYFAYETCLVDGIPYFSENPYGLFDDAVTEVFVCSNKESHLYGEPYSGRLVIPNEIVYGNKTFAVTRINPVAFSSIFSYSSCNITSVELPNTIQSIGEAAFTGCTSLERMTVHAVTPPEACELFDSDLWDMGSVSCSSYFYYNYEYIFFDGSELYAQVVLFVPYESVEAYRAHAEWGRFTHIVPFVGAGPGDINGDGNIAINDVTGLIDQLLGGEELPAWSDVDGDGNVSIKDVTALIDQLLSGN